MYIPYVVITASRVAICHRFYNNVDCIPYAAHDIPVTYSLYNWKFVPLFSFTSSPVPLHSSVANISFFSMSVSVSVSVFVGFFGSTCRVGQK